MRIRLSEMKAFFILLIAYVIAYVQHKKTLPMISE
jgi:hypothetical protein